MPSYLKKVAIRMVDDGIIECQDSIVSTQGAKEAVAAYVMDFDREIFGVISLDAKGTPLNVSIVSIGCLFYTPVHPREVFKAAILSNAAAIVAFHNHPSGSNIFSEDDIEVHKRMRDAGKLMGIKLIDSILITGMDGRIYSMGDVIGES